MLESLVYCITLFVCVCVYRTESISGCIYTDAQTDSQMISAMAGDAHQQWIAAAWPCGHAALHHPGEYEEIGLKDWDPPFPRAAGRHMSPQRFTDSGLRIRVLDFRALGLGLASKPRPKPETLNPKLLMVVGLEFAGLGPRSFTWGCLIAYLVRANMSMMLTPFG